MKRHDSLWIVVLGLAGLFGSVFFVTSGELSRFEPNLGDLATSRIHLWLLLIGSQGAIWGMSLILIIGWWRDLLSRPSPPRSDLLLGYLLPFVLMVASVIVLALGVEPSGWPPANLGEMPIGNLRNFALIGNIIAVLAVAGMMFVGLHARTTLLQKTDPPQRIREYLDLQRLLDGFLLIAALILGLGTLATAALRDAYNVVAGNTYNPEPFRQAYVIIYGGLYSIILGITYAASRAALIREGVRIRKSVMEDPPGQSSEIKAWSEEYKSLTTLLRLSFSSLPALGETFSVLAPLIVGAATKLL